MVLLPAGIVLERVLALVGVFVVGGAFEAKYGNKPGVDVGMRSEPKSAAEPGLDVFGCGRDHHILSSEVVELRNSRALLAADILFACEVECRRAPLNIQGDPPEVLTGATVVEHCRLDHHGTPVLDRSAEDTFGKWDVAAGAHLGRVTLVWVSRAGQETGPGSNLVGETEVAFFRAAVGRAPKWRFPLESNGGFGSEKNGPSTELQSEAEGDPEAEEQVEPSGSAAGSELSELLSDPSSEAGSWSRAELVSGRETVDLLVVWGMEDEQRPKTADDYEAECETKVVEYGRAAKPA